MDDHPEPETDGTPRPGVSRLMTAGIIALILVVALVLLLLL